MWEEITPDEDEAKPETEGTEGKAATPKRKITFHFNGSTHHTESAQLNGSRYLNGSADTNGSAEPLPLHVPLFDEAFALPVTPLDAKTAKSARQQAWLAVALLAVIVIGVAVWQIHLENEKPHDTSRSTTVAASPPPPPKPKDLVVDVIGAVHRPGVYHLKLTALADDALKAAGGPTPEANLNAVNLASPVVDETQLLIPSRQLDSDDNTVAFDAADPATAASSSDVPKDKFAVYVTGAVNHPGVYYLKRGMRNIRALLAAGGVTAAGDTTGINKAAIIRDGDQIWVPTHQEYLEGGAWSASSVTGSAETDDGIAAFRGGKERPVVDIEGAVRHPGVYFLDRDSRKLDALKVAGGATEAANLNAVNLARFVEDGTQIYVPTLKHPAHTTLASSRSSEHLPAKSGFAHLPSPRPVRLNARQTGEAIVVTPNDSRFRAHSF